MAKHRCLPYEQDTRRLKKYRRRYSTANCRKRCRLRALILAFNTLIPSDKIERVADGSTPAQFGNAPFVPFCHPQKSAVP